MKAITKDYLDELTEVEAETNPQAVQDWEAIKIIVAVTKARKDRGLTQADVAQRMGLPQQRVAALEKRPWGVSFGRVLAYARAVGVEVGIVDERAA